MLWRFAASRMEAAMPRILRSAVLALMLAGTARAETPPISTVVLFDSICLTCHEGECSGRMALRTRQSEDGLAGHVTGYAGRQDDGVVGHLKTLMTRLKTECRLPVPDTAIPADGRWTSAALAPLQLPDRTRAFIPLGWTAPGEAALTLSLATAQRLRVQVVATDFDIIEDREVEVGPAGAVIRRRTETAGEQFLRLIARDPMDSLAIRR